MSAPGENRPGAGIAFMLASMFLLVSMDAVSRHLTQTYAVSQILLVRFVVFSLFAVALVGPRHVAGRLASRRPWLQVVRAAVLTLEIATFVLAVRYLPLGDVHAVAAATPLLVAMLAAMFLGEKVGWRRWSAIAIGFGAVLAILRPGFRELEWFHFLPLFGALLWAVYQILVRFVSRTDGPETTLLYTAFVGLALSMTFGLLDWRAPDLAGWGFLLLAGILGAVAHFFLIKALSLAEASMLQPFSYSVVLWAVLIGFISFGEFPDAYTLGGGAVIVLVGLYTLDRERRLRAREQAAAAARRALP
jgi:drug/metabolite transporter (DMT)-like permease